MAVDNNKGSETIDVDGKSYELFKEGKARFSSYDSTSFYNPVQEFNRDLTICVLRQFVADRLKDIATKAASEDAAKTENPEEPKTKKLKFELDIPDGSIRILDALSASGLRALRFSQEVPNVASVLANDFSEDAVEAIKKNVKLNNVDDKVTANFGDAVMTMMTHRGIDKRFHAVDLDPYGSASVFLDSAVQCVADRGILMVTCTDMAVLCGNTPEASYNKYESIPLRVRCCHEFALRVLLRAIESHAGRYARYIEPLLSISVDFYVRVFVRLHTGAKKAKDAATKVGHVLACTGCHVMEIEPILRKVIDGNSVRYVAPIVQSKLVDADGKCRHCERPVHRGGPLYTAPIHSPEFVNGILKTLKETPEKQRLGTHDRLLGILSLVSEELPEVPLYYEADELMHLVKAPLPKAIAVRSAVRNAGYRVSSSHCNPKAFKTDAPGEFLLDIARTVAKNNNITAEKLDEKYPGKKILEKEIKHSVNFSLHPEAMSQAKTDKLVRYQDNKGKNWGPKSKAPGSVNSVKAGFQVDKTS